MFLAGQINDLADKLEMWDNSVGRSALVLAADGTDKKAEEKLVKATRDACKITAEVLNGMMTQVLKNNLFNHSARADIKPIDSSVEMSQD